MEDQYLDTYMEDLMSGGPEFYEGEDYNVFEDNQVAQDHEGEDFDFMPEPDIDDDFHPWEEDS